MRSIRGLHRRQGMTRLRCLRDEQAGVTLVELLTALGISTFVLAFVGTALFQFYKVTGWGNDRMLLAADFQNAELWLGRDSVQANAFSPGSVPSYGTFTIPTSTGNRGIRYAYSASDKSLTRTDLTSGRTVIAARDIANASDVSFVVSGRRLTVTILATRGGLSDTFNLHLTLRVP